jgi:hypothetical protein
MIYEKKKLFSLCITGENETNGGATNPVCGNVYTIPVGESRSIYCQPSMIGRFLTVKLKEHSEVLTLCEVEVYATDNGIIINIKMNFYFICI